ncbi:hypothetical protein JCM19241_3650 [Vibrio ishigakensis]|uniref:Uncharacterized protein n=1 Tax=Vibrio ishigakensis TaxID=1481914 RepID=A0A0B8QKV3_9VIBR|nr:hypothetical protein JCM19241_3650 [Vibrio ishigakensis]
MRKVLSGKETRVELANLNQNSSLTWELKKEKLFTSIKFNSFIEAFGFLTQVACALRNSTIIPKSTIRTLKLICH